MKNYCKTLLILCCFTFLFENAHAQAKFGIKVGANGSTLEGFEKLYNLDVSEQNKITTEKTVRYHAGLSLDVSVGKLFFRPDLEFIVLGVAAKYKSENAETEASNFQIYYLKLPAHIGYKFALNMDTDLRFGVGGYASHYLGGDKSFDDLKVKKLDYGASAIAAFDYVNISFSISYDYGLADVVGMEGWSEYRKANNLSAIRNSCLKISFAYYF